MGGVTFALVETVATFIQIIDLALTTLQSNLSSLLLGSAYHFSSLYEFFVKQSATLLEL